VPFWAKPAYPTERVSSRLTRFWPKLTEQSAVNSLRHPLPEHSALDVAPLLSQRLWTLMRHRGRFLNQDVERSSDDQFATASANLPSPTPATASPAHHCPIKSHRPRTSHQPPRVPSSEAFWTPALATAEQVADSGGSRPRIRDDVARQSDLMSLGVPR